MKLALLAFVIAAAFASLAVSGAVRLRSSTAAPPAVVLSHVSGGGWRRAHAGLRRQAVPLQVHRYGKAGSQRRPR